LNAALVSGLLSIKPFAVLKSILTISKLRFLLFTKAVKGYCPELIEILSNLYSQLQITPRRQKCHILEVS
jgi:hypothetical protein